LLAWHRRRVALFLVVRSFVPFLIAACLYTSCQCGLAAARQGAARRLVDTERRTRIPGLPAATTNAGIAIGAALGGSRCSSTAGRPTSPRSLWTPVSFLASAGLLPGWPRCRGAAGAGGPALAALRDRPYDAGRVPQHIMFAVHPELLSPILPLWIVSTRTRPRWTVAARWCLNTVAVVLFHVRVARR